MGSGLELPQGVTALVIVVPQGTVASLVVCASQTEKYGTKIHNREILTRLQGSGGEYNGRFVDLRKQGRMGDEVFVSPDEWHTWKEANVTKCLVFFWNGTELYGSRGSAGGQRSDPVADLVKELGLAQYMKEHPGYFSLLKALGAFR